MSGKVIIVSGPSATGKSTIVKYLAERFGLSFLISATTRKPRGEEKDGKDYHFLSVGEFREKIKKGEFIEYEEVYKNSYYGTLRSEIEKAVNGGGCAIGDLDVHGAMNVKKMYGEKALILLLWPPNLDKLEERLKKRGTDSDRSIKERMTKARSELVAARDFDFNVINNELEETERVIGLITEYFLKN
jgi:guanylate kinase